MIEVVRSTLGELAVLAARTEAAERAILEAAEQRLKLLMERQEKECEETDDKDAAEILILQKVVERARRALA